MVVAVQAEGIRLVHTDQGSGNKLVELIDRFERPLCGYLATILTDPDVVSDCAQDAFLRAYEHLDKGRQVNSQWLYKVARNRAIDHLRRSNRLQRDVDQLGEIPAPPEFMTASEVRTKQVLERLSVQDRELLYLSIVDRFRTEDIGKLLGIRAGAVRVRLFRARERFRVLYGGMP